VRSLDIDADTRYMRTAPVHRDEIRLRPWGRIIALPLDACRLDADGHPEPIPELLKPLIEELRERTKGFG
jgi:hypothetical protein